MRIACATSTTTNWMMIRKGMWNSIVTTTAIDYVIVDVMGCVLYFAPYVCLWLQVLRQD